MVLLCGSSHIEPSEICTWCAIRNSSISELSISGSNMSFRVRLPLFSYSDFIQRHSPDFRHFRIPTSSQLPLQILLAFPHSVPPNADSFSLSPSHLLNFSPSFFSHFRIPTSDFSPLCHPAGFICGKRMTSRIEAASVSSMTSLSIPIPSPAVGGIP